MTSTRELLSLFLAGTFAAAIVGAQIGARVFGEVTDEKGKLLPGVQITVTTPSSSTFKIEESTNEKGIFRLNLVDATRPYRWKFEKAGYVTMEDDLKVGVGANDRKRVEMRSTGAALAAGELQVDPAIEAFNAGAEAYAQGDFATARAKFEAALAANPQLAAAHAALGRIHVEEKKYAEAAAATERALALEPANTAALRVAVVAYEGLGDAAKLAAARRQLAAADPRSAAGTFFADGVKLFNAGKTEEAVAALEQALAVDPEHAKSHYVLGLCYSGMGDSAKALEHLQTFLRLAPNDPDAGAAREMLEYL